MRGPLMRGWHSAAILEGMGMADLVTESLGALEDFLEQAARDMKLGEQ